MNAISAVLLIKIFITVVFLSGPFLLLPQARLAARLGLSGNTALILRLYGVAMLALAVAYASGVWQAAQGVFPWGIVLVGILSNGGAAVALAVCASRPVKRVAVPVFAVISLAFVACALLPNAALAPWLA